MGLMGSLNRFNIPYEIVDKVIEESKYVIQLKNGKYISINPINFRDILICNGLLTSRIIKEKFVNTESTDEINLFIDSIYGNKSVYNLMSVTNNCIDPITSDLLINMNYPTNLPAILSGPALNMLLNKDISKLSDLNIYRSRVSEICLGVTFKLIKQAQSYYSEKVKTYDDKLAKLIIDENYILNALLSEGVLNYTSSVNPVDELFLSSKTIKTGPGGVPGQDSFKLEHRNVDSSQIGTLSALTTSEDANVGVVVAHTLTPAIVDEYGSYGNKITESLSGWDVVSISEGLIPFVNEMDSDRAIMATKHQAQTTPTSSNEPPLVCSGAELIVPQLTSSRFLHKAKKSGKVTEVVPNRYITVKYSDDSEESYDLVPRLSKTKMAQFISIQMNSLKVGDKFKKNEIIASSKSFNDNMYSSGRNATIAMLNYNGRGYEDAYVISENFSKTTKRDIIKELYIIIPPDVKVLGIEKEIGKKVTQYDSLVEFQYSGNFDQYIEMNNLDIVDNENEDNSTGNESDYSDIIGQSDIIKLMGIDGVITDIKVYINNKNSIDKQVTDFHASLSKDILSTVKKLESHRTSKEEKQKSKDNLDLKFLKNGNHKIKNVDFSGAAIKYYIRQETPLEYGDKIATRYGTKGVISTIIPEELTPYSKSFPRIDTYVSTVSVLGRKNIAFIKEIYLGKVVYFLNVKVKEMIDSNVDNDKIISFIDDIYKLIAPEKIYKSISNKLNTINFNALKEQIINNNYTFRVFIPPFSKVTFEDIKQAADILKIPLDEKVYIPELKTWTKTAVPVGMTYFNILEQMSDVYSNIRSVGKYQASGQAARGKSNQGGQSISNLDTNAFLSLNASEVLKELFTIRSDDHKSKRQVINQIISEGKANIPSKTGGGGSQSLFDIYLTAIGLDISKVKDISAI
jgi:DNA-directed RNA polymerase beta subunit